MRPLTQRQHDILMFIRRTIGDTGRGPSIREIGKAMGMSSPNGVNDHLIAMEKKGVIERGVGMTRSIRKEASAKSNGEKARRWIRPGAWIANGLVGGARR